MDHGTDYSNLCRKVALGLASEAQWSQLALVLQKSGSPQADQTNVKRRCKVKKMWNHIDLLYLSAVFLVKNRRHGMEFCKPCLFAGCTLMLPPWFFCTWQRFWRCWFQFPDFSASVTAGQGIHDFVYGTDRVSSTGQVTRTNVKGNHSVHEFHEGMDGQTLGTDSRCSFVQEHRWSWC